LYIDRRVYANCRGQLFSSLFQISLEGTWACNQACVLIVTRATILIHGELVVENREQRTVLKASYRIVY